MSQPSQPNLSQDELPTQRIPRVKMPAPQSSRQEKADPGAADPPAVMAAEKADAHRELGKDKLDGAQHYRKRVEEAQLPDNLRKAALREVGKLERTSDQSPESGYIRIWLDTVLGLPWSTQTTDPIDIQPAHEVDPAATETDKVAQNKAEPAAAPAERPDTAPAGSKDDDTIEMPAVRALPGGGPHRQKLSTQQGKPERAATGTQKAVQTKAEPASADPHKTAKAATVLEEARQPSPQLREQQVLGPVPVEEPPEKKHFQWLALGATVAAALLIGALLFDASRDGGVTAKSVFTASGTSPTVRSPTSEPSDETTDTGGEPTIQLEDVAGSARAYKPVRIEGVYRGGADTFVRVQRWEEGSWVFFRLPTRTDPSGRFTAYVGLGTGRHRLRMVDPRSGVTSEPFVLVVKG
jgi:hypothetical protein